MWLSVLGATSLVQADVDYLYSEWSERINLGPPVNTVAGEQAAFMSKDGLSL
jgi:hypothetical protein